MLYPYAHSCMDPEKNRVCMSVEHMFYLTDEGRALPCMIIAGCDMENECLKLSEHSLESCMSSPAYEKFLALTAKDVLAHNPKCAECEFLKYCGCGCRGASQALNGDFYGVDKTRCLLFRGGWAAKLKELLSVYSGSIDSAGDKEVCADM